MVPGRSLQRPFGPRIRLEKATESGSFPSFQYFFIFWGLACALAHVVHLLETEKWGQERTTNTGKASHAGVDAVRHSVRNGRVSSSGGQTRLPHAGEGGPLGNSNTGGEG